LNVRYDLQPLTVVLFITAIINAWLLSFLIQYMNGLLAFWITQAVAVFDLWFGLWSLFSGYLIPLDLMPSVVQRLAFWLPFRYQLAVPLEIILGRLQGTDMWISLGMQWLWIAIAYSLCRLMWQRGLRRYSAVGA
jgi:ABC-2 type transport system permease protein